jgi:hypothetical protein
MNNFLMILETFLFIRFSNVAVEISSYGTTTRIQEKNLSELERKRTRTREKEIKTEKERKQRDRERVMWEKLSESNQ